VSQRLKEIRIFGYPLRLCGIRDDVDLARQYIVSGRNGRYMACANPHSLVVASTDSEFNLALQHTDILVPDGAGIVLAAKILNLPIKERVAGSDFFLALSDVAEKDGGLKYFFLGSTNEVLDRIRTRLAIDYPSIEICGTYSPPYKDEFDDHDNEVMIDLINKAKPDVLWVGMTAPKQEKWIFKNKDKLAVPFAAAIGAVFDFYAETVKRPSPMWQKLGLEWLGRFLQEPRRLWRRNFVSTPIFLYWVLKEKLHQMFGGKSTR
jgi:N-acetylglucosaminyldiphosphoundecaprenol N-acetyl-beta-D-mannosaminyltransferase